MGEKTGTSCDGPAGRGPACPPKPRRRGTPRRSSYKPFSAYNISLDVYPPLSEYGRADRASSAATNHALQLVATDLEYEVTRVKSPVLGRDMNPMGRGDGTYYAQGNMALRGAKPGFVERCFAVGFGSSVNNDLPDLPGNCGGVEWGDAGKCCCGHVACWSCMPIGITGPKSTCTPGICDWGLMRLKEKSYMRYCCDCIAACCLKDGGWPECGFTAGCGYSSESMDEVPCYSVKHGVLGPDEKCGCEDLWPPGGKLEDLYDEHTKICARKLGIVISQPPTRGWPDPEQVGLSEFQRDCTKLCMCRWLLSAEFISELDPTVLTGIVGCLRDYDNKYAIAKCILGVLVKAGFQIPWKKLVDLVAKYLNKQRECQCQANAVYVCNQLFFGGPKAGDECCGGPVQSLGTGLWQHCTIKPKRKAPAKCWTPGLRGRCEDFVEDQEAQ